MRIVVTLALLIMFAVACEGPVLEIERLEVTNTTPPDESYNVKIVNSKDSPGLCKTGPAKGPIIIQAYTSPVDDLNDNRKRAQGGTMIVGYDEELAPGDSVVLDRSFVSGIDPAIDKYLILQVRGRNSEIDPNDQAREKTNQRCTKLVDTKAVPIK